MPSTKTVCDAREGESVVPGLRHPVLSLPQTLALDSKPSAQRVMDGEAEELPRIRLARPRFVDRLAEEEPKARASRAELRLGTERQVDLEIPGQEEDPIDGGTDCKVEEIDAIQLVTHDVAPVREDRLYRHGGVDPKAEIEIRESIARSLGFRSNQGGCNDPRIGFGPREEGTSHPITVFWTEENHGPKLLLGV